MSLFSSGGSLLAITVVVLLYGFWKVISFVLRPYTSSLRHVPGPPNPSWIYGHLPDIFNADSNALHEQWFEQYGPTIKYKAMSNSDRFCTMDTKALGHILAHSEIYQKPEQNRFMFARIVGDGLVVVEGGRHKAQRKVLNPAFGPLQIRELTGIFVDKANELRDLWFAQVSSSPEPMRLDVVSGLSKMTLDVIGLAGFGYDFGALRSKGGPNELHDAFKSLFGAIARSKLSIVSWIQAKFPALRDVALDESSRTIIAARKKMEAVSMRLVAEKKKAVLDAQRDDKKAFEGRDLLSLLIKANMSPETPDRQRLSDKEVLAQVPTFMTAGHETTSNTTAFALFALAKVPAVQQKLREELLGVSTDAPTMDEISALPYLDAVLRETLRVESPVPSILRVAVKDDVVPLETPLVDTRGQTHTSIRIEKGTGIFVPILTLSHSKEIWGNDACEFNPDRWINGVPKGASSIPGVWGHTLTFLGGPRACIGYRFAIVEIKCLLFALIRAFEFSLAVPAEEIVKKALVTSRPLLRSEMQKGSQLPLLVSPYRPA